MKRNRIFTNKYLLLAVVLIAMLALSGCRTRITNNSEVSNVKYDEDGFLSETYQMRRDELGLSIAEKPLLPDLGSPEDEEDSSEPEIEENLNVVQEEDTYVEPPTTTEARNNATTNRTTTTRRVSRTDSDDDAEKVNIIFDANNGTIDGKAVVPIEVKEGSTFNTPPTPTREGYTSFTGWYTEQQEGEGEKVNFPCKVDEDMYLYAHWGDITVIFDANEGKVEGQDKFITSVKKGSAPKFPNTPTLKNNTFKGWHTDKEKDSPVKEGTVVNENVTYYAHWEVVPVETKVKITFDADGGTIDGKPKVSFEVKKGEKVKVPHNAVHPEKEFERWAGISGESEVVADSNTTYIAIWREKPKEPEEIEIKFNVNGGKGKFDPITVEDGKYALPENEPEREGYKFEGWFTEKQGGTQMNNGDAVTAPITLYAQWSIDGEYWEKKYYDSIPLPEEEDKLVKCYFPNKGELPKDFITNSGAIEVGADGEYKFIILILPDDEEPAPEYTAASDVIIIPTDSKDQLAYCIAIAQKLYKDDFGISPKIIEELNGGTVPNIRFKEKQNNTEG